MKVRRLLLLLVLPSLVVAGEVKVNIDPDRADGLYQVGDETTFTISVTDDGQPYTTGKLAWALSKDGVGDLGRGTADLAEQPIKVSGKLAEPGVLRVQAGLKVNDKYVYALGGAAYDWQKLQPAAPPPDDFDGWWTEQKKLLAAIPPNPMLEPNENYSKGTALVSKLTLDNLAGSKVRGWYSRPKEDGKYPAVLTIPGAGVGPTGPASWMATRGWLVVNISVHDQPVDQDKPFYDALYAEGGALNRYYLQGRENRDTFYYRRVFLGFVRCIDFLTAQPEWDGKTVLVFGSSQGGGSTLVAAGLDPRVTAASANVPALCDHKGLLLGRTSGWPRLIPSAEAKDVIETAGYYDAANFAKNIRCPVLVSVGLVDATCPATSVFAAFNAIASEQKTLLIYPKMGHTQSPEFSKAQSEFIDSHR